jgi:hypothetical protein
MTRCRLVVLEHGALSPQPDADLGFEQTVIITQPVDERPEAFALRVLRRIALGEHVGRAFSEAALSASGSTEPGVVAARRSIAFAIAKHGELTGHLRELVVVAPPRCGLAARAALVDLADELLRSSAGPAIPVSLRFAPLPRTKAH